MNACVYQWLEEAVNSTLCARGGDRTSNMVAALSVAASEVNVNRSGVV